MSGDSDVIEFGPNVDRCLQIGTLSVQTVTMVSLLVITGMLGHALGILDKFT